MRLLQNAIDSIVLGLEDYASQDRRRVLSAVRNLHAGVLLLLKEKLRRLSPPHSNDALLHEKVLPKRAQDGSVAFVGTGRKTVDAEGIRIRLDALGVTVDWKSVRHLSNIRNDIEHFQSQHELTVIRDAIAGTCAIVHGFMRSELDVDPAVALGEAWRTMLAVRDVFDAEQAACEEEINAGRWSTDRLRDSLPYLTCASCSSRLLAPVQGHDHDNPDIRCRACCATEGEHEYGPRALLMSLGYNEYTWGKEGDEYPLGECPACGQEGFVGSEGVCGLCGEEASAHCTFCGERIPMSEMQGHPLCGHCTHNLSRDD
jgi:hypothetical protein